MPTMASYGVPPYHESSLKSALRLAAAGLGAVPRGANFGTAFAAAAGGASRAYSAAQQAAQEYALKQQQAQEEKDFREYQKMHLEAQTDALRKPPPEPKAPYGNAPWYMRPEYANTPAGVAARRKAEHLPTPGSKVPKTSKPAPIPRRIPAKSTEQSWIDSINQETDPAHLQVYVTGAGAADSPNIRKAAQLRVGDLMRQAR